LAVAGGLLALCCIGGVIAFVAAGDNDNEQDGTSGADENAVGTVGTPVRDGKFEFVVKNVECGKPAVGDSSLGETAQGQFCLVGVSVKNIGTEPQILSDSDQKAFGSDGAEYNTDSAAGIYANGNNNVWLNEINPGNQIEGVLVYDIPTSARIARLELHDSAFSGGAKVNVS
jgi:hypothetical protein